MSEVVALVGDIGQVACAATVHKSQGSEYPAVVIPVLTQHYPMLPRNLLYTGVARGKQLVVLMASPGFRVAHGVAGYPPSLSSRDACSTSPKYAGTRAWSCPQTGEGHNVVPTLGSQDSWRRYCHRTDRSATASPVASAGLVQSLRTCR